MKNINLSYYDLGEMAERFKAHAWKVCVPSQVPWVRIPLSPPEIVDEKCHFYYIIQKQEKNLKK